MLSRVLHQLEVLQSDLAAIDPTHETEAADAVAAMAVALRDLLAQADALGAGGVSEAPRRRAAAAG